MAMMAELEIRLGENASYCHYPQEAKQKRMVDERGAPMGHPSGQHEEKDFTTNSKPPSQSTY
jgi:hypothetical protein